MLDTREDLVRALAYHLWEAGGRNDGNDVHYWRLAEIELLQKRQPRAPCRVANLTMALFSRQKEAVSTVPKGYQRPK